jgi:outer membrane immunogenic protein
MKRVIAGVVAVFMFTAGQAAAEGLAPPSRIAAPGPVGPNWNGFYVGVGIGAGSVVQDLSVSACPGYGCYRGPLKEIFSFDGIGGEGIFGTVTVGYDRVIRSGWVAGVFADYDFGSTISSDVSLFGASASIDHNYSWAVGGRLGFLASPSTLLYGTAGYTQAEFDYAGLTSKAFDGYFVGAGIETFLRQNWTLKLEYRYSQFNSESLIDEDCFKVDLEPSSHTARLVLSYKFGQRAEGGSIKD